MNFACAGRRKRRGQTVRQWDAIGPSSCFTSRFAARSRQGGTLAPVQSWRNRWWGLPVWASPWLSDASHYSWPAPGSSSSLEAVRCSVSTFEVSARLRRSGSEQTLQRACFFCLPFIDKIHSRCFGSIFFSFYLHPVADSLLHGSHPVACCTEDTALHR